MNDNIYSNKVTATLHSGNEKVKIFRHLIDLE